MKIEEKRSRGLSLAVDGAFVVGAGLITYGAHLAWAPAGFIVPGILLLAVSVIGART
jgi:hypothetical protein